MWLQPRQIPPVPDATAQVTCAAFPKGNLYLRIRNELGSLYKDEMFARINLNLQPPEDFNLQQESWY